MKRTFSILTVLFLSILFLTDVFSQSFYTGAIGVNQSNGGRQRVFSDNLTTRQIERISILVGVSTSAVFDYNEDQNSEVPAATVGSPLMSDFEVTSTINNTYSNLPPNVSVSYNIYGWTNDPYLLVKTTVKNNETSAINAAIGLEIIPRINGTYENDTLQWDASTLSLMIHKGFYVNAKFLSHTQKSLKLIPWTDPYANDSLYYAWLTQNSFDPMLVANAAGDGAVAIMGQDPVSINPGESTVFYYGVSIGANYNACVSNMALCIAKYNQVVPVELTSFTATAQDQQVTLNWSTATELNNNGFEIQRSLNNSDFVTVGYVKGKGTTTNNTDYVYVDRNLAQGNYSYRLKQIDFNGQYEYSEVINVLVASLDKYALVQNYPNPFNPSTKIGYILKDNANVKLSVYNSLGEEVAVLVNDLQEQGYHQINFDASGLPSGIYYYTINAGDFVQTKKMLLIK